MSEDFFQIDYSGYAPLEIELNNEMTFLKLEKPYRVLA